MTLSDHLTFTSIPGVPKGKTPNSDLVSQQVYTRSRRLLASLECTFNRETANPITYVITFALEKPHQHVLTCKDAWKVVSIAQYDDEGTHLNAERTLEISLEGLKDRLMRIPHEDPARQYTPQDILYEAILSQYLP